MDIFTVKFGYLLRGFLLFLFFLMTKHAAIMTIAITRTPPITPPTIGNVLPVNSRNFTYIYIPFAN